MRDIKSFLANLPHSPGVYQMLDKAGTVLYVGKAKNLKNRVSSYFKHARAESKVAALMRHTDRIEVTVTHHDNEALLLECNLIKKLLPRYNILLRDDKSYPYIVMTTSHAFPRIDLYRGARKKGDRYFGPYANASAARETVQLIQKLFQLRTCRDHFFASRKRPCLLYQIQRCSGPCVLNISAEDYLQHVRLAILFLEGKSREIILLLQHKMEEASMQQRYELAAKYRDQIQTLNEVQHKQYVHIGEGDADIIGLKQEAGIVCLQLLTMRAGCVINSRAIYPKVTASFTAEEVMAAFISQHYLSHVAERGECPKTLLVNILPSDRGWLESALTEVAHRQVRIVHPLRGEKKQWLKIAIDSAEQALAVKLFNQSASLKRLRELQALLHLKRLPERLECFDISHTRGEATVGACVVFDQHGPLKRDYRYFRVTGVSPGDDIAAMRQVLTRHAKRLQTGEGPLPDVIIIDGGKTQLAAAQQALSVLQERALPLLVAISKGPQRKRGLEQLHRVGHPILSLPEDSPAFHLIQHIRDEAHRFAIRGHRARRDKARTHSTLESIPGVGEKRRRALLRYFGGIQGIARASLDELVKVPGIHQSLAERIFSAWHDTLT